MDIINRTYAPSLHQSSAKTLFEMNMCSKKIDYILITITIVAIIWLMYRQYKYRQSIESMD